MTDLLLTHGYFLDEDAQERRVMRPYPPLGLLYLSSHLKSRGLPVAVFDSTFRRYEDFLRLLHSATAIVGNSSVAIRECSYLGVPAVNIGSRQLGRERGQNVIDVDHDRKDISDAVRTHIKRGKPKSDLLYGDGKAGGRIADCLSKVELKIEKRLTY